MPKSKRHDPQAESEKISRAKHASVERTGASADEDEDAADNDRDYASRAADPDDSGEG
ncbi:RNA polymerase sigma factor RpoS, partial [Burkholderia pseudomallei]